MGEFCNFARMASSSVLTTTPPASNASGVGIISVVIANGRNLRVVDESRTVPYCVVDLLTSAETGLPDEEYHSHPVMSLKSHSRTDSGGGGTASSSHGIGIALLKKKKNKKKVDHVWNETYHFPVDMHETYTKLLHWNFKALRVQVMVKAADGPSPSSFVLEHKLGEVIFPFSRLKNNIEIDEWFKLKQAATQQQTRKLSSSPSSSTITNPSTPNMNPLDNSGAILEKPKGEIRMKLLYLDAATHKRKIKEKEEQNKQSRLLGYMDEVLKSFLFINNEVRNKSNLMFMLDMMRENQSVYVQIKAIKFLSQYTRTPDLERKRLVIEMNGLDLLSESMKNFPNIVELQRDARQTVANLTTDEFRPMLISKGLIRPRRFY